MVGYIIKVVMTVSYIMLAVIIYVIIIYYVTGELY